MIEDEYAAEGSHMPEIIDSRVCIEIDLPLPLSSLFNEDIVTFAEEFGKLALCKPNDRKVAAALHRYTSDPYERTSINEASIRVEDGNVGFEEDRTGWIHFTFDVDYNEGCRERDWIKEDEQEMFDIKIRHNTAVLTGRELHERPPDEF